MLKRMAPIACLLALSMFAGIDTTIAGGTPGLAALAVSPANPDGSIDGIATFGGGVPDSTRLDGFRGLGLRV